MSTSEQTSDSKREPGYYFVKDKYGRETIAEWVKADSGRDFWSQPRHTGVFDSDMQEIDERRIERTSPQQHPDLQQLTIESEDRLLKFASANKLDLTQPSFAFLAWRECFEWLAAKIQPDELSKAQARIRELEERVKYLEELSSDRLQRIINNEP